MMCIRANGIDGWAERICTEERACIAQCPGGRLHTEVIPNCVVKHRVAKPWIACYLGGIRTPKPH